MSRVVQLSDFRLFPGRSNTSRPQPLMWNGLHLPDEVGAHLNALPKSLRSHPAMPCELECTARVLRSIIRRQSRLLFLDAGIGLLPALAAQSGARRVIAFEAERAKVAVMAKLFSRNHLGAEAILGTLEQETPSDDQSVFAVHRIPSFDRDLILEEEKIDTIVLTAGITDPTALNRLSSDVEQVVITDGPNPAPAAERDRLIVHLISEGLSYDPAKSERYALVFRRAA